MNICITGVTGGIGQSLVKSLCKNNYLILIYRNKTKLDKIIKKFKIENYKAIYCDANDVNSIKKAIIEIKDIEIDILIYGAGVLASNTEINENNICSTYMVNLVFPIYLINSLKENINHIFYISSLTYKYGKLIKSLENPRPKFFCYSDSKLNAMHLLSSLVDNIIFYDPFIVDTDIININRFVDSLSNKFFKPFIYDAKTSIRRLVLIVKYNKFKTYNKKLVSNKKVKELNYINNENLLKEILKLFK